MEIAPIDIAHKPVATSLSVVSANFNNGRFLHDFFSSILLGTWLPGEIVIADDGSTDNSREIIAAYQRLYPWIKPVFLPQNKGVAHATNAALQEASGEWILRCDPDDLFHPQRVEKQYTFLQNHLEIDVLGTNCLYVDGQNLETIGASNFPQQHEEIGSYFRKGENGVLNGTTCVKRSWFMQNPYRQEWVWAEDYDVFAHMFAQGARFAALPEPLTLVRIHRQSATSNVQLDTLVKAHKISKALFGNRRSLVSVYFYYLHILFYRKSLLERAKFLKWMWLLLSAACRPDKVFRKIFYRFQDTN